MRPDEWWSLVGWHCGAWQVSTEGRRYAGAGVTRGDAQQPGAEIDNYAAIILGVQWRLDEAKKGESGGSDWTGWSKNEGENSKGKVTTEPTSWYALARDRKKAGKESECKRDRAAGGPC